MPAIKLYTGNALKTLTNTQVLDPWSDWSEALDTDFSVGDANKAVAWFYRCVVLRASAVSAMPFNIEANGKPVDNWPYQDALIRLLYLTEAALCLRGQAYWLKQRNRVKDLGCRWLAPTTMEFVADNVNGLTGFKRTVSGTTLPLSVDDVVYFWMLDPDLEVGPGAGPGEVALKAAGIANSINEFSDSFFKRGAIPAVLLTVEGNPSQDELKKLQEWWKRLLQGAKKAWETVAIKAQVKPQIIQQPMKDLAMTELKAGTRSEIAVAFGVPETMLEESAATYATASAHRKSFYTETILPECDFIQAVINEQWLSGQGLRLIFQPEELEVMQEDEAARAASLKALVDAGVPLKAAMLMLGYDLSDEVLAIMDEEDKAKEERREQMAQQVQQAPPAQPTPPVQPEEQEPTKSNGSGELMNDLERWRRKALKALKAGKPASVDFESEHIPADMALLIQAALTDATDPSEVKAAFAKATDGDTAALMDAAIQHQVAALVLAGMSEMQYGNN